MTGSYGFIGLGAMGYPMAMNIRRKMPPDETLFVYDVYRPNCERFEAEFRYLGKIEVLSSCRDVAEQSHIIISIVPASKDVEKVYLDESSGVAAASKDSTKLFLECSTIESQKAVEVAQKLQNLGMGTYVDTPVSGGVPGAVAGTLSFMIGRADAVADSDLPAAPSTVDSRLRKTMEMMGSPDKFFYCGKTGAGLAAKISNNYLSGTILLATAEAMATGIKLGIDKSLLYKVIQNSTGQSFMCDHVNPVPGVVAHAPASRDYHGGFKAQMMVKDMTLGVNAAESVGIRPSTGRAALELYKESAVDPRCIDRDVSVVYRFLGGLE